MGVLGTFTKQSASSVITVTWTSAISSGGSADCAFQIRIDGLDDQGVAATTPGVSDESGAVTSSTAAVPSAVTDVFSGLAAGQHTVSVWNYGASSSNQCVGNAGEFPHHAIVVETTQ